MSIIWKDIEGFGGRYEVSNTGRVRSKARNVVDKNGHIRPRKCVPLLQKVDYRYPYRSVDLYETATTRKTIQVHRLVLEAFVGKRPEGMQCRHLDGNPGNNDVTNLRWDTTWQNALDKTRHGTQICGRKHWCAKLTEAQILQIRKEYTNGAGQILADKYGVSKTLICDIVKRKVWKHVQ